MSGNLKLHGFLYPPPYQGEVAGEAIKRELLADKPSMIARFGATEIKALLVPRMPFFVRPFLWKKYLNEINILSGFFPPSKPLLRRFSDLMFEDMRLLDVLGSWRVEEFFLKNRFPNAVRVPLYLLEPYFCKNPWSEALEDRKVLVVHPFQRTIESQYHNNRKRLFKNPRVLPEFASLQTVKAVQTIAGNLSTFPTWFDALAHMKAEIDSKDYDVAILGCGAYGFPLAAHIKRQGKKAIHLGGATQLLFGIRGRRWESMPAFKELFNDSWIRASKDETPSGTEKAENHCFW